MRSKGKPIKIFFAMAENLRKGQLKAQLDEAGIKKGLVCVKVYLGEEG